MGIRLAALSLPGKTIVGLGPGGAPHPPGVIRIYARAAVHPESTGPDALQRAVPERGHLWEDAGMRADELLKLLEFWRR